MPISRVLSFERTLFLLASGLGLFIIWQIPHLPMIDLPQHVGQVALLHDLIFSNHPFAHEFRIDFYTPYLIVYSCAALLTTFMPALDALKILLSMAFLAYLVACRYAISHFKGEPFLIWICLPSFFGICWMVGLLNFLVGAPFVLYFIVLANRYARTPGPVLGLGLIAVASLLFMSHILALAFALSIASLIWLAHNKHNPKLLFFQSWPYVFCLTIIILYWGLKKTELSDLGSATSIFEYSPLERFWHYFSYQVAFFTPQSALAVSAILIATFALTNIRKVPLYNLMPLLGLTLACLLLPQRLPGSFFVFNRFALFLLPFLALTFRPALRPRWLSHLAKTIIMASVFFLLVSQVHNQKIFSERSKSFDLALQELPEGQRILSLVSAELSEKPAGQFFWYYGAWYQSLRGGIVEPNFAHHTPQIVRYRIPPPYYTHGVKDPLVENLDWRAYQVTERYDMIFIFHSSALPANLFDGANCRPQLWRQDRLWSIYKVIKLC